MYSNSHEDNKPFLFHIIDSILSIRQLYFHMFTVHFVTSSKNMIWNSKVDSHLIGVILYVGILPLYFGYLYQKKGRSSNSDNSRSMKSEVLLSQWTDKLEYEKRIRHRTIVQQNPSHIVYIQYSKFKNNGFRYSFRFLVLPLSTRKHEKVCFGIKL